MPASLKKTALFLAVIASGPLYADCIVPTPPTKIPDGSTATLDEMRNTQKLMKSYNDLIKAYTDCLRLEQANELVVAKDAKISTNDRQLLERAESEKNNRAVDQATEITGRFNEQVRIYKARSDQRKS